MKFFIEQDARAVSLAKDTTYMGQDIRTQDSIIAEQKLNENDLKDIINTQQVIIGLWETDAKTYMDSTAYWKGKFVTEHKKVKLRNKVIFWETAANLFKDGLAIVGTYLYIKP